MLTIRRRLNTTHESDSLSHRSAHTTKRRSHEGDSTQRRRSLRDKDNGHQKQKDTTTAYSGTGLSPGEVLTRDFRDGTLHGVERKEVLRFKDSVVIALLGKVRLLG